MPELRRNLPVLGAGLLLATAGFGEAFWTGRWAQPVELQSASDRMASLPLTLGEWRGTTRELDADQISGAQLSGYLSRDYVHRATGATVSILLVCGRPGPVSVHTPDICYQGAGYNLTAPPARTSLALSSEEGTADFWSVDFRKEAAAVPSLLRIRWAWNAAGPWRAPDNPRFAFARYGAIYKLYVIRHLVRPEKPSDLDPALDLVRFLLPELQKCLYPGS